MSYKVYYQRFFSLLRPDELRGRYLGFTHRLVTKITAQSLDEVYHLMQGEVWSPQGEARSLIASLHLEHTSLSVGDVIQDPQGNYWLCNYRGWTLLNQPVQDQGPPLWLATVAEDQERSRAIIFLKISDDPDYLPPEAATVESFGWTAFEDLVTLAKKLEQYPGFAPGVRICIDLGEQFYETAEVQ